MNLIAIKSILFLLFFTVIFIIIIAAQIKLSKKYNKIFGLILPILSFIISILTVLNMLSYFEFTEMVNGAIVSTEKNQIGANIMSKIMMFILMNIPTVILSFIYFGERNKLKFRKTINAMKAKKL